MKYVIIGAGPAGLTAGYELVKRNQPVAIFEKEAQVGGLAKTVYYKGNRFDIGGHRFFAKIPQIIRFWHQMLGKNLISVKRSSKILYGGKFFNYPLEPVNALNNLGPYQATLALLSYSQVRLRPIKPEKNLEDVYINSFGRVLYEKFFQTYSTRLWGLPPTKMEPDWGKARVGKLSLLNAVKDAFFPKEASVKSLIKKFQYPKLGPGQMWEAVAKKVKEKGGQIFLSEGAKQIFYQGNRIIAIETQKRRLVADRLVSTMPLRDLVLSLSPKPPVAVVTAAKQLKYRDFIVVALMIRSKHIFSDQWIYIQDPGFTTVRVQNINNWSNYMVKNKNDTILGLEYVTSENEPFWQKTDREMIELAKTEAVKLGFCQSEQIVDAKVVRELKAYPVYDLGYKKHLETVKNYLKRFANLTLIGRNGTHQYNNMDQSMLAAMLAVENFFGSNHNLWEVNADEEYLERKR